MAGYHGKNNLMSAPRLTWRIRVVPREISSLDVIFISKDEIFLLTKYTMHKIIQTISIRRRRNSNLYLRLFVSG